MITGLVSALIAYVGFLVTHLVVFAVIKIEARVKAMFLITLLLSPLVPVCYFALKPLGWDSTVSLPLQCAVVASLVFMFIWFGYMQFYFIVERGISPRFLQHIWMEKRNLTVEEIQNLYPFKDVVRRRIIHMIEQDMLEEASSQNNSVYKNSEKGHKIGWLGDKLKRVMQLGNGG